MTADIYRTRQTFSQLMDEYGPAVYRLALSYTGKSELAEDVYQQTFLLLLEKKPVFSSSVQLKVWLLRSARKIASSELRRENNRRTVPLDSTVQPAVFDSSTCELYDFLSVLDLKYREPVLLFYIEDMSVSEIARALGISVSAVKTRLFRARAKLQEIYKEELL